MGIPAAMKVYDAAWAATTPFLRRNRRLADGFSIRTLKSALPGPADLWIQSASAGEAHLTATLIDHLACTAPLKAVLTTNTRQGLDILNSLTERPEAARKEMKTAATFFPFDRPSLMERAVRQVAPRLMVVMETELWPGLLYQLKRFGIPVVVVNGRITPGSLKAYRRWPGLWRALSPDRILAISEADARRFAQLFPNSRIETMPNLKFDRIKPPDETGSDPDDGPLRRLVPPQASFIVLGSVRTEEEDAVERMIAMLMRRRPDLVVGLVPRHLYRLEAWERRLNHIGVRWRRRSSEIPAPPGSILLWDVFGELQAAYRMAGAAFVGGSLAPLGGQNFLEPLACGTPAVIGSSWENFEWVGPTLFDRQLVQTVSDGNEAAGKLLAILERAPERGRIRERFMDCIRPLQGGGRRAAEVITEEMASSRPFPVHK